MIRTMEVADKVLEAIEQVAPDASEGWILEPYCNGRERGWAVYHTDTAHKVAFSENRNSDEIVVYCSGWNDFNPAGNVPVNKAWDSRKYFRYNDFDGAAQVIVAYLIGTE